MAHIYPRVTVATITHGERWKFLSQVINAVMRDPHVVKLIIVDNGSEEKSEIREGVKIFGDKVTIVENERNLGSAGGFAVALEHARGTECDFVLLLDDDSVPQDGIIDAFMDVLKFFPDQKVVLSGSRHNVLDNKEVFYRQTLIDDTPHGTFFEVFSSKKIIYFLKLLTRKKKEQKRGPFVPIIPSEGFVYGGVFIPIVAVREAALPDKSLFLYGDDIEYSWNIRKLGYACYVCTIPKLYDVDQTFGMGGSHIFGQFDPHTAPFKVYYRIRNMVRLSRKHTHQSSVSLFLNIMMWMIGLYILGLAKYGPRSTFWSRVMLMNKAVYAGYFPNSRSVRKLEESFF